MLGAILGDIIGSSYEFRPTFNYNFELFPEDCGFTDDTICTIGVADAIMNHNRDYLHSVHDWCRRYPNPKGGYGGSFARWVASDDPQPYYSFGNGSAMRVSAIGWLFEKLEVVSYQAHMSAAISHDHPEGIIGAQVVAEAIWLARNGHSAEEIASYVEDVYPISEMNIEYFRGRFDETCMGTVPAAFLIIKEATGFEDAIRRAVSLGADADTLGAIVGSIAEAIWGIPEWMRRKAMSYLTPEMAKIVNQFYSKVYGEN